MVCDPSSLCPDLYKALSIELYNLNPCLKMLFFCSRPMAPKYQHRDATGHTVADDQEAVFEMPSGQLFECAEFTAIYHGAMSIAFLFM